MCTVLTRVSVDVALTYVAGSGHSGGVRSERETKNRHCRV